MNLKVYITIGIASLSLLKATITKANGDSTKLFFQQSYNELKNMLEGKQPVSFEKAVFLSENPYWNNKYTFTQFENCITENLFYINLYKRINDKSLEKDFSVKIDYNEKRFDVNKLNRTEYEKRDMYVKTLTNWAIYNYMTDTTYFVNTPHYPFTYNINDPFGISEWKNSQVLNLLTEPKQKGNCFALVSLFKIFSERLKSEAYICTAPQHIYLQHRDIKGDFYNVELATGTHPGDGSIKTLTYTDIEAIANGIALRRLTKPNEYVSLCLINLAKAYEHKFNTKDDDFILQCSELALKHDSLNLNAMLLNAQVLEERVLKYANKKKASDPNNLRLDKNIATTFKKLEVQLVQLNRLGYHQMPVYMQEMILAGLKRKENEKIVVKDRTPNPFPSLKDVAPEDKRYSTLSGGLFEEVHEKKPVEQYGRFRLNIKNKKIVQIVDTSNFQFLIDPVVFAWQVDPLAHKQPYISPYNAFNANPIYYVDPDGRIVVPADEKSKAAFETQLTTAFAGQLAQFSRNIAYETVGSYQYKDANGNMQTVDVKGFVFKPSEGVSDVISLMGKIRSSTATAAEKAFAAAYVKAIGDAEVVIINSVEKDNPLILTSNPVKNTDGYKAADDYAKNPTSDNLEKLTGAKNGEDGVLYYPSKDGNQVELNTGTTFKPKIVGAYMTNKATPQTINESIGDYIKASPPKFKNSQGQNTYLDNNGEIQPK